MTKEIKTLFENKTTIIVRLSFWQGTTIEVDGKSVIKTGQYENNYRTGNWLVYYLGSKDKIKMSETTLGDRLKVEDFE